ncbi:integrin alpha-PS2-like [Corticium candelabrum]|uniref:integrin alpha-PS2-like n=1 Tax=Corticium candelabrum TaxID=121492 RepID=UPI002E25A31E|nr:integrin alpha-PS2-like [Corticium candelabrum]
MFQLANLLIVGAPRDNTSVLSKLNVTSSGAVYRCKVDKNDCEVINVDTDYVYGKDPYDDKMKQRDILSGQWLGSSISASNSGNLVVCAHRYADKTLTFRDRHPIGRCTILNTDSNIKFKYTPCKDGGRYKQIGVRGISFCQAGSSVKMSEDGSLITVGGPGAYLWNGMDFCKIL